MLRNSLKLISWIIILLFIIPHSVHSDVYTDQEIYTQGSPVLVNFSGFPAKGQARFTIVSNSTPIDVFGERYYTKDKSAGKIEFTSELLAGRYEVRVYFKPDEEEKGKQPYRVIARQSFLVIPRLVKIGWVQITYSGWEVHQKGVEIRKKKAETELERSRKYHDAQKRKTREISSRLYELQNKQGEKKRRMRDLYLRLITVEEHLKSKRYKDLEKSIQQSEQRMRIIEERIETIRKDKNLVKTDAISQLLIKYEEKKSEIKKEKKILKSLDIKLGITADMERKKVEIDRLNDQYLRDQRTVLELEHLQSSTGVVQDEALDQYLKACSEYDSASLEIYKLKENSSPLILSIHNEYFHAEGWDPGSFFRDIDKIITSLGHQMKGFDSLRRKYRKESLDRAQRVQDKARALNRGTYLSYLAQAGVEFGDALIEALLEFKRTNVLGALVKLVLKEIELLTYGTSFEDAEKKAEYQIPDENEIYAKLAKRFKKTASTHPRKAAADKFRAMMEKGVYQKLFRDGVHSELVKKALKNAPWAKNMSVTDVLERVVKEQRGLIAKLENSFKSKVLLNGKAALLKELRKSLVKGIAKDIAKTSMKKAIAEYLEGQPLREYLDAQMEMAASNSLWKQVSHLYWETKDIYDGLRDVRNSVVRKFDPESEMIVDYSKERPLEKELSDYIIQLTDARNMNASRDIELTLGGVKAERVGGSGLKFRIPAEKVLDISYRKDGAALKIKVIK